MNDKQGGCYCIRVREKLDTRWRAWFDGLDVTHDADGSTSLCGSVPDQPALHGLLRKISDLHLTLLLVEKKD